MTIIALLVGLVFGAGIYMVVADFIESRRDLKLVTEFLDTEAKQEQVEEFEQGPAPVFDDVPEFIYQGIYRRRPLMVEARRWDGSYANAMELLDWMGGEPNATYQEAFIPPQTSDVTPTVAVPAHLWIHVEEGALEIRAGDYIVKEPYPAPGRQFDRLTPEEVEDNLELLEIHEPVS